MKKCIVLLGLIFVGNICIGAENQARIEDLRAKVQSSVYPNQLEYAPVALRTFYTRHNDGKLRFDAQLLDPKKATGISYDVTNEVWDDKPIATCQDITDINKRIYPTTRDWSQITNVDEQHYRFIDPKTKTPYVVVSIQHTSCTEDFLKLPSLEIDRNEIIGSWLMNLDGQKDGPYEELCHPDIETQISDAREKGKVFQVTIDGISYKVMKLRVHGTPLVLQGTVDVKKINISQDDIRVHKQNLRTYNIRNRTIFSLLLLAITLYNLRSLYS